MQLTRKSKHNNSTFKKWTQQNAELKFSASNKEEDDSNKPRSRENIASPSEEAVDKRHRGGYSDYRHVQTAVTAAFFRFFCIQFNSVWMHMDKTPQLQCEQSRWREGTADASRKCHQQDSQRQRSGEALHSRKFCKIHVSDIFPTDWAENIRSAITPWATTGSNYKTIDPTLYFHDVLEQPKANFHTNFCSKRILGFLLEYAWIPKLLRDAAFTWQPRELSCGWKSDLFRGIFL